MFSTRTEWDFRHSTLYDLLQRRKERGDEVIDLTESNPTRCGFWRPSHELIDAASLEKSVFYAPDPRGLPAARDAIARWYHRQGHDVDPSSVLLASGTSEAYSYIFKLLCDVGESVAVPKPGYPLFEYLCTLNDITPSHYRLVYDGEWHLDLSSLKRHRMPVTKALALVHPNNPTGSFVKLDERDRVLALLAENKFSLIVDEVFGAFSFEPDERRAGSFASTKEVLTFTVNGLSKFAGLPQLKLAWIVVSGPQDLRDEALQRLEVITDTYLSVGTPVQHALPQLLEHATVTTGKILERVKSNYEMLNSLITGESPVSLLRCEGGWNAVLRLPATQSDDEWATRLLANHGVLVHPGHLFDFEESSYMVVSLLPEADIFAAGIQRITQMTEAANVKF